MLIKAIITQDPDGDLIRCESLMAKEIIKERDEDGNVMYWHKCTKFMRKKK